MASRFAVIQPGQLGPMAVLEDLDADQIIADRMAKFAELWAANDPPSAAAYDVLALEFDPIKINHETAAFFETLLRNRVNQSAKSVTLAFGSGSDLDAIASRYPGGVPRLSTEGYDPQGDDRYRRRIWLSPNILTPHGTAEAYIFWALNAGASLRDAAALNVPHTGTIRIPILNDDPTNPIPSQEQILAVYRYINDASRRGLTDTIDVVPPYVKKTKYRLDLWRFPGIVSATMLANVRASLEKLIEASRWLGVDHTLMAIHSAAAQAGVYNAVINEPATDVVVAADGFVQVTGIELADKGVGE